MKTVVFQDPSASANASSSAGAEASAQERGANVLGARARGSTALERAIAEGAITLTLSHPHVVSTYCHEIKPMHVSESEGSQLVNRTGSQVCNNNTSIHITLMKVAVYAMYTVCLCHTAMVLADNVQ